VPDSSPASSASPALPSGPALDSSILRVLMDSLPDHIYFKDLQSRVVRNNIAHARSFGKTPEECVGKTDFDFFAREHAERALRDEQHIIKTGEAVIAQSERLTMLDGSVFWGSATKLPWRDEHGNIIGTFGVTRDITAQKNAEDNLTHERNLLRTIVDHLPSRIFVKDTEARYVLNNTAHLETLGVKTQQEALGRTAVDFFSGERALQAMSDDAQVLAGGPPILNQEKSDFGSAGSVHWSLTTKVPLKDPDGRIAGIVGISHDITRRKLAEEEVQRHAAEVEADVRMARQVQEIFLPRQFPVFPRGVPPEASSLRFSHRYIPATTLGGDFFQVLQFSDSRCGVLICDVMGHGVRAGLLTAMIRGVVGEMDSRAEDPSRVIAEINHALAPIYLQTGEPIFATAFFGVIDTNNSTLTFCNAGHPPPLIRRGPTSKVDALELASPEPAAGLLDDFIYTPHIVPFESGDMLLCYTDGLFEASDANGLLFGETRLRAAVGLQPGMPGADLIEHLISEVVAHTGCADFEDDICVFTVESTGNLCALRPALNYEI